MLIARLTKYRQDYLKRSEALARRLAAGEISITEWLYAQRQLVRALHTAAYREGRGSPLDLPSEVALKDILLKQDSFLNAWATSLSGGMRGERVIVSRAMLYYGSANATYQRAITDRMGLPPLPGYPGDGTTSCWTNCKCVWLIEKVDEQSWDCHWQLRPAEHCPNCRRRSEIWKPLRIRDGVIETYNPLGLFRTLGQLANRSL